ncbi:MAG: hypothetical protein R6X02_08665 [Enhygromyxa sp.]
MPRASLIVLALCAALAFGCKESGNDYLDAGLRLLGEAERGDCKAGWDKQKSMNTIDGTVVARCLDKTKEALEQLHKARELGVETRELNDLIAKTEEDVRKLESMLKIVSRMQRDPSM